VDGLDGGAGGTLGTNKKTMKFNKQAKLAMMSAEMTRKKAKKVSVTKMFMKVCTSIFLYGCSFHHSSRYSLQSTVSTT
jgi:hypothetical protein